MADATAPTVATPASHRRALPIVTIIASLILGALCTLLVGIGCALWTDTNPGTRVLIAEVDAPNAGKWRLEKYEHDLMIRLVWYHRTDDENLWNEQPAEQVIPRWSSIPHTPVPADLQSTLFVVFEDAVGWPCRSQTSQSWWNPSANTGHQPDAWSVKFGDRAAAANLVSRIRVLPFRPMWPGFGINTALYALPWFVLLMLNSIIRRARRSRRGLCIRCGFDLRGGPHDFCPECGAVTPPRPRPPRSSPSPQHQ